MDFLTLAAGAFVGALAAFCFNFWLQRKKQREENLAYLIFARASLIAFTNNLYLFKRQFVMPRVEAAQKIKSPKDSLKTDGKDEQRILRERLYNGQYDWPFAIERLGFIAQRAPDIIEVISSGSYSTETLKNVVISINDLIDAQGSGGETNFTNSAEKLDDQVNKVLRPAEKSIKLLAKAEEVIFKSRTDIEGVDPKYHDLKPTFPEDWEEKNWFLPQQQRCCCAALMDIFRC